MHPDDRERVRRSSDDADRAGTTFHEEYRIFAKDGRIALAPRRLPGGGPRRGRQRDPGAGRDVRHHPAEAGRGPVAGGRRTATARSSSGSRRSPTSGTPPTSRARHRPPTSARRSSGCSATPPKSGSRIRTCGPIGCIPRTSTGCSAAGTPRWPRAGAFTAEYRIRSKAGELLWIRDEAIPVADGASGPPHLPGRDVRHHRATRHERTTAGGGGTLPDPGGEPPRRHLHRRESTRPESETCCATSRPEIERLTGYTAEASGPPSAGFWESLIHPEDRDRVVGSRPWRARTPASPSTSEYRLIRSRRVRHLGARHGRGGRARRRGRRLARRVRGHLRPQGRRTGRHRRPKVAIATWSNSCRRWSTSTRSTRSPPPIYVSPQYERLTGYSPEHRLATPDLWVKMLHPEDRERVLAESDRTNESGEPFDIEYRIVASRRRGPLAARPRVPGGRARRRHGLARRAHRRHRSQGRRRTRCTDGTRSWRRRATRPNDSCRRRRGATASTTSSPGSVNRVGPRAPCLFENLEIDGELQVQLRHAWLAAERPPSARPPTVECPYPYGEDFGRWQQVLAAGGVIHGLVSELPERERPMIESIGHQVARRRAGPRRGLVVGLHRLRSVRRRSGVAEPRRSMPSAWSPTRWAPPSAGSAPHRAWTRRRPGTSVLVEQIPAITYIEDPATGDADLHESAGRHHPGLRPGRMGHQGSSG